MRRRILLVCGINWLSMSMVGCANVAKDTGADHADNPNQGGLEITYAYIGGAVSSPLGKFLLIRKGAAGCAVRFTSFYSEGNHGKTTAFFTREPTRTAKAEWYFQGDGSFDFNKANVVSGKASLKNTSSFGIGRWSFKPFATLGFDCGTISVPWSEGIRTGFTDKFGHSDFERELAPSKWTDLKEIDFDNPRLIWTKDYQYDAERERAEKNGKRYLPLEALP